MHETKEMNDGRELVEIVIKDPDNRIFVEICFTWSKIKLFWWLREENEDPIDTAIRELQESYWIKFTKDDLKLLEITKDLEEIYHWVEKFYLYSLCVSNNIFDIISSISKESNSPGIVTNYESLKEQNILKFSTEKEKFLLKVEMALSLSNEVTNK